MLSVCKHWKMNNNNKDCKSSLLWSPQQVTHFKIQYTNTDQESNAYQTTTSVQFLHKLNQTLGLILHYFFLELKNPNEKTVHHRCMHTNCP